MSRVYVTDSITADGTLEKNQINATASMGYTREVSPPSYTGPTMVSITDETVTLATQGKKMNADVVINQGIPLYAGATSYVIEDSGLTIATNGKRLNSNITIDISALETLADEISEVVG